MIAPPLMVARALFPTYVARYLMTQSSPALLEKLEVAVEKELAHLRGNTSIEDAKLYIKVRGEPPLPPGPACVCVVGGACM